jgi:hypothetical protein
LSEEADRRKFETTGWRRATTLRIGIISLWLLESRLSPTQSRADLCLHAAERTGTFRHFTRCRGRNDGRERFLRAHRPICIAGHRRQLDRCCLDDDGDGGRRVPVALPVSMAGLELCSSRKFAAYDAWHSRGQGYDDECSTNQKVYGSWVAQ